MDDYELAEAYELASEEGPARTASAPGGASNSLDQHRQLAVNHRPQLHHSSKLSADQKLLLDKALNPTEPLVHVDAKAGTGKTHMYQRLGGVTRLVELAQAVYSRHHDRRNQVTAASSLRLVTLVVCDRILISGVRSGEWDPDTNKLAGGIGFVTEEPTFKEPQLAINGDADCYPHPSAAGDANPKMRVVVGDSGRSLKVSYGIQAWDDCHKAFEVDTREIRFTMDGDYVVIRPSTIRRRL
ncbi:hypothetical protein HDU88_005718 [Geranomyces variabilis]|nr:hypothetical protein HDU88_005718 [Geranomyces variabilis]